MAPTAPVQLRDTKPTLPVSPASSGTMGPVLDGRSRSSADATEHADNDRQRSHSEEDDDDDKLNGSGDAGVGTSPASDEPARKRRRSRKGLDKRFECTTEGCGKSYSRAEHLYRHQLNHNSKQTFHCQYPDCTRTFVRGDLLKRHMDRHTAKGSQLNRRDSMAGQTSPVVSNLANPSDAGRPTSGFMSSNQHMQYHASPGVSASRPYSPAVNTTPVGYPNGPSSAGGYGQDASYGLHQPQQGHQSPAVSQRPLAQPNGAPYGVLSPAPNQQGYSNHPMNTPQPTSGSFVPQQQVHPMTLPPAQYSYSQTTAPREAQGYATMTPAGEYSDPTQAQSSEMMMLGDIAMAATVPVFGGEENLSKSPYAGMPEDFMAFLFNSPPGDGSPMSQANLQNSYLSYGDLHNTQYSVPFFGNDATAMGYFPNSSQHVMAVNNLLDQNVPEATISEEKSQEIYDFIKEHFHENEHAPVERQRDGILDGDRTNPEHMLSKRMMQAYIGSYWYHFSEQMPILHKPTFSPDKTPHLLLMAMMIIGAACLDRTHGPKVTKAGAQLSNFLAWHLRWEIFMDVNFRPPAKLWIFQTLILLELYEKMYSTRELHERAHIHHATTITLMRRGRSLIGKSTIESPPNPRDGPNGSRHSSTSGMASTPEQWWSQWITNESTRRTAFAAFVIDSIHATMFGHSGVMVAHEMRLPLPCDESLWRATSPAEVGRVESNLMSRGIKPVSFLEGLKRTLSSQEVRTNSFGRTILMAGLLSVSWHMHQRDLQVNVLGGGVIQALGGRDKWRGTLTRAYDSWRSDFDQALEGNDSTAESRRYDSAKRTEYNIVFESRTVLHHLAHMAMQVDIVDCQMFARAKRLLGRSIGSQEFNSAQRRITEAWAPSARARDATYYGLKFLCSVLAPDATGSIPAGTFGSQEPYHARDDALINRPWVLYFAALVVWCYGFALEGPCSGYVEPSTPQEKVQQMKEYLRKYGSIKDPNELRTMRGVNYNTALLMVLKDSFENTRWELLHEGSNLLNNCIVLNSGGSVS